MKGIEKQILKIIKGLQEADIESISVKLGVSSEYAAQVCSILAKDEFIEEKSKGKFKLTLKGKELTGEHVKARKPLIRW